MQSAAALSERRDHLALREFSQLASSARSPLLPGRRMLPLPPAKRHGRVASFLNARQLKPPLNGCKRITVCIRRVSFLGETEVRLHRSLVPPPLPPITSLDVILRYYVNDPRAHLSLRKELKVSRVE